MFALAADIVGILAGFFLMLPAAKDNLYRFIEARQRQKRSSSPVPGFRNILVHVWREKRDAYSAWDTMFISLGGIGLMVSFALKLAS